MTQLEKIEAAQEILRSLEIGTITAMAERAPKEVYAGDVVYNLSNGWKVTVFNDCGDWDYIDSFQSPTGEILSYDEINTQDEKGREIYPEVAYYIPTDDVRKRVYSWP